MFSIISLAWHGMHFSKGELTANGKFKYVVLPDAAVALGFQVYILEVDSLCYFHLKLLSANLFSLEASKICCLGNG